MSKFEEQENPWSKVRENEKLIGIGWRGGLGGLVTGGGLSGRLAQLNVLSWEVSVWSMDGGRRREVVSCVAIGSHPRHLQRDNWPGADLSRPPRHSMRCRKVVNSGF